jgi:hypothetical protein
MGYVYSKPIMFMEELNKYTLSDSPFMTDMNNIYGNIIGNIYEKLLRNTFYNDFFDATIIPKITYKIHSLNKLIVTMRGYIITLCVNNDKIHIKISFDK